MYALIDISNQMLEDSAFDMEGEIRGEATEQFAVQEGAEIAAPSGPARSLAASGNYGHWQRLSVIRSAFMSASSITRSGHCRTHSRLHLGQIRPHRLAPAPGRAAVSRADDGRSRVPAGSDGLELLSFGDQGWGDEMLRGALMTLAVSLASMALGLALGALGAAAKLSALAPARWLAGGYTHGRARRARAPRDLSLFFGGNGAAMFVAGLFGYHGYIELNAFTIGTFAVGVVSGAYSTEVIRGAVLAVPRGQIEAAQAIGMSRLLCFAGSCCRRSRASRSRGSATSGS